MIQRTWGQVKATLAKAAGAAGMQATDARVLEYTNLAVEELLNEGDFPGVVDRWLFNTHEGLVALPYWCDRLMQITTDGVPKQINSPWYEFVQYGPGQQYEPDAQGNARMWVDVVMDRGDVATMLPVPVVDGPWKLRVYAVINEAVDGEFPEVNIQGLNAEGEVVNTLSNGTSAGAGCSIGETLTLVAPAGYVETASDFASVSAFIKPRTCGYLRLTAWNGTDEVELASYAPQQTACSFRQYFVPYVVPAQGDPAPRDRVILARCRRRFVPIEQDNDILIIGNLPALREMVIALWKRDSDSWEDYVAHKGNAVDLLRKEATAYLGKAKVPSISFQRGFALGSGFPFVH